MKRLKRILKYVLFVILIPVIYFLIALLLSAIPVNRQQNTDNAEHIYLSSNGVHLDVVLPMQLISADLKKDLKLRGGEKYCAFGWGDRAFYLETPKWEDLTLGNTLRAAFWKSSTLMHVSRYRGKQSKWVKVPISDVQLQKLNQFIAASFQLDEAGKKQLLPNDGYYDYDEFYEGVGSYSVLYNCNTWANDALKSSGLKACIWTVFDFSVLHKNTVQKF